MRPGLRCGLVGAGCFAIMEPVTYLAHRYLMHGPGWALHRSHHRSGDRRLEANDIFPAGLATVTMIGLHAGLRREAAGALGAAIGVSAYGLAYAAVHDLYIHGRFGTGRRRSGRWRWGVVPGMETLAAAHREHHRCGGEPYGMLLPLRVGGSTPPPGSGPAGGADPRSAPDAGLPAGAERDGDLAPRRDP